MATQESSVDCTQYESESCPKQVIDRIIREVGDSKLNIAFMGCWGTYCKMGPSESNSVPKEFPDRAEKYDELPGEVYGEGYSANMLAVYSEESKLDAVILAGDNIYSDVLSEEDKEELNSLTSQNWGKKSKPIKTSLYDMEKQLRLGFEGCMDHVKTDTFLVGIGNHDIETCKILNQQLNYRNPRWKMPGLSFNWKYVTTDGVYINFVFIDTNIYELKYCSGNYPTGSELQQENWLSHALIEDPTVWNVIIGHIPFQCNSHHIFNKKKPGKTGPSVRVVEGLRDVIRKFSNRIDVYMCADEHNQQYITLPGMPPEVISGSGGAILDEYTRYEDEENTSLTKRSTHMARAAFGFVGVRINKSELHLEFRGQIHEEPVPTRMFTISKEERKKR
jgi:hypothetical protein